MYHRVTASAAVLVGAVAAVAGNFTVAQATVITVAYEAKAVTVVSKPFGLDVPYLTPITGYFTFDTSTPDDNPDQYEGEYPHEGNAGFLAEFLGHKVTGSEMPFYWVDLVMGSPTSDTFRIYDGPRTVGFEGGEMAFDGTGDSDIQLFLAVVGDVFDDDDLIDPFPFYDFAPLGNSHTFFIKDEHGQISMDIDKVTEVKCGDVNSGGIKASDALEVLKTSVGSRECLPCVCDVDHNGTIASSDALKTLRYAVNPSSPLSCSACL